jgi:putative ABC transport system substrate-binding protein
MAGLGGAAAWPLAARAQRPAKLPTIGFLVSGTPLSHGRWVATFRQRLGELGWIEGRTVAIEVRWAEGSSARAAEIAPELVQLKADVIVTTGTPTTHAAKQATEVTPIVFIGASDPVADTLVGGLARPGGNVTGLSNQSGDLAGKRVQMLRDFVPTFRRLAILGNVGDPAVVREIGQVRAAADMLGVAAVPLEIRRARDIAPAFEAIIGHADALYVRGDLLTIANRIAIITWALGTRLPALYDFREDVEAGGLMSYGASTPDLRRAADYVDRILRGAKPENIPVEQPTKFEFIINLTTAKVLGLTVPDKLLALANEVIE